MKLKSTIATLGLLAAVSTNAQAQLVINELMQSNIDCITDDLNEFPDSWVELYNTGATAVNLGDYKLGTKDKVKKAWQLPNKTIGPKQYVIIYCDKAETADRYHTDFRLESGKDGEIYLFKGDEIVDSQTGMKKQPAPNIAYGRKTDGSDKWGYQAVPTPGKANCGETVKDLLGAPVFSEKGRVITQKGSVTLTLSLPEDAPEGAEIRYTLTGEEPTKQSLLYQNPITISTSRVVRATVFCNGYLSPRSTVHSYIFFTDRELTLPVISIATDKKYLEDPKFGIYVDGNYEAGKKNYEFDWRRPINFEFFEKGNEDSQLNQLCETRIMGGATRSNPLKSLAVYANKRFGEKRLEYEFFPDQRPGITDFKSIQLRNAGNDFDYLYMRDAVIQRTMAQHVDLDWQSWRPAIIYINGVYKGIQNIRDRSNEDNIYTYYDSLEDIDMFENWGELKSGDWDNYNAFKAFYNEHGHTMAEYEKWMDCGEFANLMIMNLYYNNRDFPGNNIVMWRPQAEGGRWRWIAKDTDFGLGLYDTPSNYNTIAWLNDPNYAPDTNWANQYDHTRLFRRLMEDKDFFDMFIDRCAVYMGDFLNGKGTCDMLDSMYDIIKTEYPNHRNQFNPWWPDYNQELNKARNWVNQRTDHFYNHIANYYKTGTPTPLTVNKGMTELENVQVSINGIPLSEGIFDGKFFANRSVTLTATDTDGKQATGWDVTIVGVNGTVTQEHKDGATYTFTMPACSKMTVKMTGLGSGISTVKNDRQFNWRVIGNQLLLSHLEKGTDVAVYDLSGRSLFQGKATDTVLLVPLGNRSGAYILKVGNESLKIR